MTALGLAVALACVAPVAANIRATDALAAPKRAAWRDAESDEFRTIRAAEIAANSALLEALARGADAASMRRIELAREAIALRREARTVAEVRAAELGLCEKRRTLAESIASKSPACASELLLEAAEDALLRALGADASDLMLSAGLATQAERERTRALCDVARGDLARAEALAKGAGGLSFAFRADMLGGLAALAAIDAGSADDLRAAALERLSRAAASKAPRTEELAALLALARARALERSAATRDEMLALLDDAQRTPDAATAFAARALAWSVRGGEGPFPAASPEIALLGATAELRARVATGGTSQELGLVARRALEAARARGSGPSESARLVQEMGAQISTRLDDALHAFALQGDAPHELFALAAAHGGTASADACVDSRAAAAARDPLCAPWFALPLAKGFEARGEPLQAAAVLESCVDAVDGMPLARELIELALVVRRADAESTERTAAAAALDRALEIAARRLASDPDAPRWILERVDLALASMDESADLARAEGLLRLFPAQNALEPLRGLREGEISALRALALPAGDASRAQALRSASTRLEEADGAVDALASRLDRATLEAARARLDTMRAALADASRRPAEAITIALRAVGAIDAPRATRVRAAAVWLRASLARGGVASVPAEVAALAAESAALRALMAPSIESEARAVEELLVAGDAKAARERAAKSLAALAPLALTAGSACPASLRHAAAVAALAGGDAVRAASLAREALAQSESEPAQRAAEILLAEALRAGDTAASRAEAFELLRALSPLSAQDRDLAWWRAQCAQLEMLAGDAARSTDLTARINRLKLVDPSLGDARIARRIDEVERRVKEARSGR